MRIFDLLLLSSDELQLNDECKMVCKEMAAKTVEMSCVSGESQFSA